MRRHDWDEPMAAKRTCTRCGLRQRAKANVNHVARAKNTQREWSHDGIEWRNVAGKCIEKEESEA